MALAGSTWDNRARVLARMPTLHTIGIDFGTANSCVAYAAYLERGKGEVDPDPLRRPEVVTFNNRDTIPSAVHLGSSGQAPVFGYAAEDRAPLDPQHFATGFKLHLGRPDTGAQAYALTVQFLNHLRKRVAQFVPLDNPKSDEIIETVLGHPVQWDADQREITLRAAEEAGFPNVRLEEESLAALYCHVFDERANFYPRPGSHVLTVDMGGGTTDFAFLKIPIEKHQRPESIPVHPTPEGNRPYGGRELDRILFAHLARQWDPAVVQSHGRSLLREVRKFKEAFSDALSDGAFEYEAPLLVGDRARRVQLTRAEFEQLAQEYIKYLESLVRAALKEAELRPEHVAHLIVTGGHSRWYWVERTLGTVFPHLFIGERAVFRHSHPEQSVARGLVHTPFVRSSRSGFLAPVRRALHPVWMAIPGAMPVTANGKVNGSPAPSPMPRAPVLLVPQGQLLPFRTDRPLRFAVEQVASDVHESRVRVRFLSGSQQMPLTDRVATFQRSFWEQVLHQLPWTGVGKDRFEVQLLLSVDEHEIITGELGIARMRGSKRVEIQKQRLRLNVEQSVGRDIFGALAV